MKQARAFGVGVMVSTQNPVDVDYKGLSNAGTWFLGRLQTERDKARVLDGLEGAAAGTFDRASLDRTLSALGKRIFLLHNVHEPEPVVFETRWTLSYLRGPMTKDELRRAARPDNESTAAPPPPPAPPVSAAARPVVPAGVREFFVPAASASGYEPRLYGAARVAYSDPRRGVQAHLDVHVMAPFGTGAVAVRWDEAGDAGIAPEALATAPFDGARFAPPPAAALDARNYPVWERDFSRWLAQARPLRLFVAPGLKLSSQPGEDERDFRIRARLARHEQRDATVERLRAKYAPRVARLTDRLARAQDAIDRERQQVGQQKLQTAVSIGATVIGALMGRRAVSASTLGRATTAARSAGRAAKEAEDVARAEARAADVQAELTALQAELQAEIDAIAARAGDEPIETVDVPPARGGIDVRLVALVWRPA
jgi:hypothetical protein